MYNNNKNKGIVQFMTISKFHTLFHKILNGYSVKFYLCFFNLLENTANTIASTTQNIIINITNSAIREPISTVAVNVSSFSSPQAGSVDEAGYTGHVESTVKTARPLVTAEP